MIKYLNYIEQEIHKSTNKSKNAQAIKQINLYKKYWNYYKHDLTRNPLNNHSLDLFDKHKFNFHTNEQIEICWNVDGLYLYAADNLAVKHLGIQQFEMMVYDDLLSSFDELLFISEKVQVLHEHQYVPLLIMKFKPMNQYLILDGRHRYIEYKKFKSDEKIPVYIVDDTDCINYILHKNELVAYTIVHNIKILNDYLFSNGSINELIDIKKLFHMPISE